MDGRDFHGWIPFGIRWQDSQPLIDWCHIGGRRLTEPFFDQTIQFLPQECGDRCPIRVTPAEWLLDSRTFPPAPDPAGFIFHAARCGSTLIARMFASMPSIRVFAEPDILQSLLRAARGSRRGEIDSGDAERALNCAELLRAIVHALARSCTADERHYVIKFHSSAISDMALIRQAFPSVPWTFVYREPIEILGAQVRASSDRLPAGLENAGLLDGDPSILAQMTPAEFWTRVLADRYRSAVDAIETCGISDSARLNYRQLPAAVWETLLPLFRISGSPEDMTQMQSAAAFNAKAPTTKFADDRDRKRRAAAWLNTALVDSLVLPHYQRLESIRTAWEIAPPGERREWSRPKREGRCPGSVTS